MDTHHCTATIRVNFLVPGVAAFVFDTLVFLAISTRLAVNAATFKNGCYSVVIQIVNGKGLYHLSRALMRSGLLYYL